MGSSRLRVTVVVTVLLALAATAAPARTVTDGEHGREPMGDLIRRFRFAAHRERVTALREILKAPPSALRQWKVVDVLLASLADEDEDPRLRRGIAVGLGDLAMGAERTVKEQVRDPFVRLLKATEDRNIVRFEAARQLLAE